MVRIVNTKRSKVKSEAAGVCVKSKQGNILEEDTFGFFFSSLASFIAKECKLKSLWFEPTGLGALALALKGTWDRI